MDSRRAYRSLSTNRTKTPYERPTVPSTPKQQLRSVHEETPNSIFSRVKNLLTPRFWSRSGRNSNTHSEKQEHIETANFHNRDRSIEELGVFNYPSPAVPRPNLDKFNEISNRMHGTPMQSLSGSSDDDGLSPNQRLAEFFRRKGSESLSEIETEGVLSLIRQAAARNESLIDLETLKATSIQQPAVQNEPIAPSLSRRAYTPLRTSTRSSTDVPQTPRYSPFYSNSKTLSSISKPQALRRQTSFVSIPTPYRPGSRSLLRRQSPVNSPRLNLENESEKKIEVTTEKEIPHKPLSQTASALLSLIGDDSPTTKGQPKPSSETSQPDIPDDVKPFVNPYVLPAVRRTPRRPISSRGTASTPGQAPSSSTNAAYSSPSSVISKLEKTQPKFDSSEMFNKYKPKTSSGLRDTISNITSPDKTNNKRDSPTSLFKFSPQRDSESLPQIAVLQSMAPSFADIALSKPSAIKFPTLQSVKDSQLFGTPMPPSEQEIKLPVLTAGEPRDEKETHSHDAAVEEECKALFEFPEFPDLRLIATQHSIPNLTDDQLEALALVKKNLFLF